MKSLKITLSALLFGVGFGVLGAGASPVSEWIGVVVLGTFGVFIGVVLGGYRGRLVDWMYGSPDGPKDDG